MDEDYRQGRKEERLTYKKQRNLSISENGDHERRKNEKHTFTHGPVVNEEFSFKYKQCQ